MKHVSRLFMIAMLSLSVAGFAATKGTVTADTYQSPLKNFTVPLPSWQGLQISDQGDEDSGRVTFFADHGQLRGIVYISNGEDSASIFGTNEKRDVAYRSFLRVYIWPMLYGRAPKGAKVVHEESVGDGDGRAYFVVVAIPEGSTLTDIQTHKRRDSVRGLIIFEKHGFMYMIEEEMNNIAGAVDPQALAPSLLESSQAGLKKVRGSMVFK